MPWFEEKDESIFIWVRVIPRASKDGIAGVMGTKALKIRVQAPPVDGKANARLIQFLSRQWNIPRSDIEIVSGETGRNKRLRISSPTNEMRNELLSLAND